MFSDDIHICMCTQKCFLKKALLKYVSFNICIKVLKKKKCDAVSL